MTTEREERQKILEKLRKLKEQADSTEFPAEADTAWRLMGKIIVKYQIEEQEVEDLPDDKGGMTQEEVAALSNVFGSYNRWESSLASAVAMLWDCETLRFRRKRPWTTMFMGKRQDVLVCVHYFDYLRREVRRSARKKWKGDSRNQGVYATAMTNTLIQRLKETFDAKKEALTSETTAIIHMRRKEAEQFSKEQFPNQSVGRASRGISGDRDAILQGREDGRTVPLSRPIHGTGTQRRTIK